MLLLINKLFPVNTSSSRVLLLGDAQTGKTSLAFRLAYEEASLGGCPLLICSKGKLEQALPLPVFLATTQDATVETEAGSYYYRQEVLHRIHIKYIESSHDLLALLAGLHAFQALTLPTMIILDDFSAYIDTSTSMLGPHMRSDVKFVELSALTMACLDDAICALQQKSTQLVKLIVTDTCREGGFIHGMMRYVDGYVVMEALSPPLHLQPPQQPPNRLFSLKMLQKRTQDTTIARGSSSSSSQWVTISPHISLTTHHVLCVLLVPPE